MADEEKLTLSICVHAEAKVGKSWLAATAPKPLLILDAEGGARLLPKKIKKVVWHVDRGDPPPKHDGWDVCIVYVRKLSTFTTVYTWLANREHPFKSVAIDSLTELQKRVIDEMTGSNPDVDIEQAVWGKVFRHMEDHIRKMRDLTNHPTRPIDCLVLTALTHMKDGKLRPLVKGQLALTLPGFPDVIGYLYTAEDAEGKLVRKLAIQPVWSHLLAGDRTDILTQTYGPIVTKPHLGKMIEAMNASEEETTE